jgi:hypothetical protein
MSEDIATALAIPPQTLLPLLTQYCLNTRAAQFLERDEDFRALQYRCHQIYYVRNFATSRLNISISISARAHPFGYGCECITKTLIHGL